MKIVGSTIRSKLYWDAYFTTPNFADDRRYSISPNQSSLISFFESLPPFKRLPLFFFLLTIEIFQHLSIMEFVGIFEHSFLGTKNIFLPPSRYVLKSMMIFPNFSWEVWWHVSSFPGVLGGSSQDLDTWLITMVIRFVPKTWGFGTFSKWPLPSWLINWGDPALRYLGWSSKWKAQRDSQLFVQVSDRIHHYQLSNETFGPLGCLVFFLGDDINPTHLYRDYFINHDFRIVSTNNQ